MHLGDNLAHPGRLTFRDPVMQPHAPCFGAFLSLDDFFASDAHVPNDAPDPINNIIAQFAQPDQKEDNDGQKQKKSPTILF